jgi:hypothetical protein
MPKRKAPEPDPDAFERMARELGCDETGEAFKRALAKVLPPRRAGEAVVELHPPDKGREGSRVKKARS